MYAKTNQKLQQWGGGGNGKVTKNSEINNSKQIYEVDFGSKARMQCAENHADGLDSPP